MTLKSLTLECSRQKRPFHILDSSPFPFLVSLFLFTLLVPLTFYLYGVQLVVGLPRADMVHIGFLGLYLTAMSWFLSIVKESSQGYHTKKVQKGLRLGMILFILSEVMLFFAFFWGFFHFSLFPSETVGGIWPLTGTQHLIITLLLFRSGLTVAGAHAYIIKNNADGFAWYLFLTILLGAVFLFCQAYEYKHGVKFSWGDNIYGSVFFLTTKVHNAAVTAREDFSGTLTVRRCLSTKDGGVKPTATAITVSKPPLDSYKRLLTRRIKAPGFYDPDARGLWARYKNIGAPRPTYVWTTTGFVVGHADPDKVWITDATSANMGSLVYIFTDDPSTAICGVVIRVSDPLRLVQIPEGCTADRGQLVQTFSHADTILSAPGVTPTRASLVSPPTWWQRIKLKLRRLLS